MISNGSITVYQSSVNAGRDVEYNGTQIENVWLTKRFTSDIGQTPTTKNSFVVRIFQENMPDDLTLKLGDFFIAGLGEEVIKRKSELENVSTITEISDNRFGNTPHWKLKGE